MLASGDTLDIPARLLECAKAEFLAHGYANGNVGRIAAAAGMSKKTVYKHVASKQELLIAVMSEVLEHPGRARAAVEAGMPIAARLEAFLDALADQAFSTTSLASCRLVLAEGARVPELSRAYVASLRTYGIHPLAELLAEGVAAGELTLANPLAAAGMLIAMVLADRTRDVAIDIAPPPTEDEIRRMVRDSVHIFLSGAGTGSRSQPR